jgi:hypothetical protein
MGGMETRQDAEVNDDAEDQEQERWAEFEAMCEASQGRDCPLCNPHVCDPFFPENCNGCQ